MAKVLCADQIEASGEASKTKDPTKAKEKKTTQISKLYHSLISGSRQKN